MESPGGFIEVFRGLRDGGEIGFEANLFPDGMDWQRIRHERNQASHTIFDDLFGDVDEDELYEMWVVPPRSTRYIWLARGFPSVGGPVMYEQEGIMRMMFSFKVSGQPLQMYPVGVWHIEGSNKRSNIAEYASTTAYPVLTVVKVTASDGSITYFRVDVAIHVANTDAPDDSNASWSALDDSELVLNTIAIPNFTHIAAPTLTTPDDFSFTDASVDDEIYYRMRLIVPRRWETWSKAIQAPDMDTLEIIHPADYSGLGDESQGFHKAAGINTSGVATADTNYVAMLYREGGPFA